MIFEIISGGEKLTGWGKNGSAYFFPGERMGRPILSPGKKLTGGKFRPVTPVVNCCLIYISLVDKSITLHAHNLFTYRLIDSDIF